MHIKRSLTVFSILLISAVFLSQGFPLYGARQAEQEAGAGSVPIPKLQSRIKVDGKLDEPAWANAAKMILAYETTPGENIEPPVKTDVFVFFSKSHIYFGLICYDPDPKAIRARYSDRDDIRSDDLININLDTFNDERRNYYFGCNPLGVQQDGIETSGGHHSWDGIWDSAAQITDKGYVVEMAIPFSALQFPRKKGVQTWGLDISRWYQRGFRHRIGLVKMDRNNNSYQSQFLKITGFEGVKPGKSIEVIPTLTGTKTDSRDPFPQGDFQSVSKDLDPGITVKWGLTSNLVLSGTVNPDFSQVEADAAQLDINQPFALYYQEKRPFFTEGADFFNSPFNVVHTRAMRDPVWGIKLSGKEGRSTIGAYYVRDNLTNLIFPGSQGSSQTSLGIESTAAVFRYKRDLGSRYTIGGIVTNREGGDYFNRVYGIDGEARFTRKNRLTFQVIGSSTRYSDDIASDYGQPPGTFSGKALRFNYSYNSRNLNAQALYQDVDNNFRADLGFMPQVGFRYFFGGINYRWQKSKSWWSQFMVGYDYDYSKDHNGNFLGEEHEIFVSFDGTMQSGLYIEGAHSKEMYNGTVYKLLTGFVSGQIQPLADLRLYFNSGFGDRIDYANARLGRRFRLSGGMSYNLGTHIKAELDHNYEKMNVSGQSLYTANITQGSLVYHLNARMFFRGIVQYVDYKYNTANYTFELDPRYKMLFTQFLFSYRLNPRTVLFLGYADDYLGSYAFKLTQSSRTLFLKVSYSWQF